MIRVPPALRRDIVRDKAFLQAIYCEWYGRIIKALPETDDVLELGSGAGFFDQFLPNVTTSEIFETPGVRLVANACDLPMPVICRCPTARLTPS